MASWLAGSKLKLLSSLYTASTTIHLRVSVFTFARHLSVMHCKFHSDQVQVAGFDCREICMVLVIGVKMASPD